MSDTSLEAGDSLATRLTPGLCGDCIPVKERAINRCTNQSQVGIDRRKRWGRSRGEFSRGPQIELARLSETILLFLTLVFSSSAHLGVGYSPDADGNPRVHLLQALVGLSLDCRTAIFNWCAVQYLKKLFSQER